MDIINYHLKDALKDLTEMQEVFIADKLWAVDKDRDQLIEDFFNWPFEKQGLIAYTSDRDAIMSYRVTQSSASEKVLVHIVSMGVDKTWGALNYGQGIKLVYVKEDEDITMHYGEDSFEDPDEAKIIAKRTFKILTHIMACLRTKETVLGGKSKSFKISKKKYHTSKLTYIRNKKYISKEGAKVERDVEWTHAFSVCGHWRTIKGIGKDRSGEYCIKGRTWVVPSVKNKHLDFVAKKRVIQ